MNVLNIVYQPVSKFIVTISHFAVNIYYLAISMWPRPSINNRMYKQQSYGNIFIIGYFSIWHIFLSADHVGGYLLK